MQGLLTLLTFLSPFITTQNIFLPFTSRQRKGTKKIKHLPATWLLHEAATFHLLAFLVCELTEKQQKVLKYEIIVVYLQPKCRNNQFVISYAYRLHVFIRLWQKLIICKTGLPVRW